MLFDHTRNTPPPNHKLTAHVADKETLLINCHCTLKGKTDKSWGQHLLQVVLSTGEDPQKAVEAHQAMKLQETHARGTMFLGAASIWKAFPVNSKPPAPSCANEPSKHNPCRTLALPKNLQRLLITSWQRKDIWKTLFQNKHPGTINPCVSTPKTPEQHKECVNQQNTVNHNSCPILLSCNFGGTSH